MENKIKSSINKIERFRKNLQEDLILVETTLNVIKYLLSESIPNEQKELILKNIDSTIKIIEDKIEKAEKSLNTKI
ncbi:hypothetical protein CPG37_09305 [Malaciobacter canalis]|uniref:Histidine kinase n=1 Tax=Malaciobacter canalis TaxID=1912871 RepID=A0ABX4LSJ1_9BACT|nr:MULTISPECIES: hypothetical protein [Malaciobacter]PHO09464.1 hypothetical protein CPG37_09305 [Malaciobacter canalis]QEE33590.1 hypothetical protein ACAN_2139 [Malaciobacter canalis]SKB59567.1 hypothetical protein SAMN06295997_12237 [Malaciobacter marinus]